MASMLMPICQQMLSSMLPQPKSEGVMPFAIQLDEQFAEMADRYFDNILDGREEMPESLSKLLKKYGCKGECSSAAKPHHIAHNAPMYGDTAPHRVYIAALDKIAQMPTKADEIIDAHFVGVTEEERRVLKEEAKGHVQTKAHAAAVNMTEPLYISRLENLMSKTKKE